MYTEAPAPTSAGVFAGNEVAYLPWSRCHTAGMLDACKPGSNLVTELHPWSGFDTLVDGLIALRDRTQEAAARSVDEILTVRNWGVRGLGASNLKNYRQIALTWPRLGIRGLAGAVLAFHPYACQRRRSPLARRRVDASPAP